MEKESVCLLEMPKFFKLIEDDEMIYVEGGLSFPVSRLMLNKSYCMYLGGYVGVATGLSQSRAAKEIFAHAVLFYSSTSSLANTAVNLAPLIGVPSNIAQAEINYIVSHSNPIDIGGDSALRIAVYNVIWISAMFN